MEEAASILDSARRWSQQIDLAEAELDQLADAVAVQLTKAGETIQALLTYIDLALELASASLSPNNENVQRHDLLAAISDLRQIAASREDT